jgi:hypothetical protein
MAAGYYCATSWRILGTGASPHILFAITNTHATTLVKVHRMLCQMDATAVLINVMPQVKCGRVTGGNPSGGTALTKAQFDTGATSDAAISCIGATASDGGGATAITATLGDILWQQYAMRMHTLVGQVLAPDNALVPVLCDTTPIILSQNQALMVSVIGTAASNPATNHWFVSVVWEEV